MNAPMPPRGSEPRLVALANRADARNRPGVVIATGVLLVVAAAIYAGVGLVRFDAVSERLSIQQAQTAAAKQLAAQISTERARRRDAGDYGPSVLGAAGLMPDYAENVAEEVWRDLAPDTALESVVNIPSSPTITNLTTSRELDRVTIEIRITQQPVAKILEYIDACLAYRPLRAAFVADLSLTPRADSGWDALIEFKRYEQRRN